MPANSAPEVGGAAPVGRDDVRLDVGAGDGRAGFYCPHSLRSTPAARPLPLTTPGGRDGWCSRRHGATGKVALVMPIRRRLRGWLTSPLQDRLGRNLAHLVNTVQDLSARTSAAGRLVFSISRGAGRSSSGTA